MNRHYLVLDAARGIAALAVVLFHLQKYVYPSLVLAPMPHLFQRSFLAVDLFFLMSGFVVARSYEAKLLTGTMTFVDFVRTRLLRLWPLYLIGTLLGFIYALGKAKFGIAAPLPLSANTKALVVNAVFLPNLSEGVSGIFPFDPAAWSLAFEWGINLIYGVWAVRQSTRRLAMITAASAAALIPCAILYGSLDMGWGISTALGGALRICFAFTLGVVIYRLLSNRKILSVNPIVLLVILATALLTPIGDQNVYYDLVCDFIVFPVFLVFACYAYIPLSLNRLFANLGRLSYALYILHNPFILWLGGAWKVITHRELGAMPGASAPPLLAAIVIGSFLTAVYVDEPIRAMAAPVINRSG